MSQIQSHPMIPADARCVFRGVRAYIYQWDQEMYDGSYEVFERIRYFDGSFVIPILPDGRILLTRQEQPAREPFFSFPGGGFDQHDEDPLDAGKREFLEETGHISSDWRLWIRSEGSPNIATFTYFYIAKNCEEVTHITPDPGEKIQLHPVTFDELMDLVADMKLLHHSSLTPIFF